MVVVDVDNAVIVIQYLWITEGADECRQKHWSPVTIAVLLFIYFLVYLLSYLLL